MEVARVMADWESDRTILFCAWSGEEYGLYGSEAYAQWCQDEGINILGYFNIDMCGYLNPGDPISYRYDRSGLGSAACSVLYSGVRHLFA